MADAQNILAKSLKALHKSGSPIILANVYDASSSKAVASSPEAKAIATASYAVAEAAGMKDDDLTRESNIRAAKAIFLATKEFEKPLSVDFQDGYGEQLEDAISELLLSAGRSYESDEVRNANPKKGVLISTFLTILG